MWPGTESRAGSTADQPRAQPLQAEAGRLLPGDAAALQTALSTLGQVESTLAQAPLDPTFDLDLRPVLRVQPPA